MNRTGIEWTTFSWNPVVGCKHGCFYCYAKKLAQRFKKVFPNGFEPTFYVERLTEPTHVKKPSKIFVCSVADLFAPWTPVVWRDLVLSHMELAPWHTYQMLTKNPELIPKRPKKNLYPDNWWFGATVTGENGDVRNLEAISKVRGHRFVSFEPLLAEVEPLIEDVEWVIVGKLTGSRRVKLQFNWLARIMDATQKYGIPLFMKNNLQKEFPKLRLVQQFPKGMPA